MTDQDITTTRLVIEGRVQGVWYRGWTEQTARALGLDGWVRNRHDGTVEAVFQGAPDTVARMIDACRDGPPAARVTRVTPHPAPLVAEPGFHQRPTA
jgi:acylphosphatase